jgi:hypothetical protein
MIPHPLTPSPIRVSDYTGRYPDWRGGVYFLQTTPSVTLLYKKRERKYKKWAGAPPVGTTPSWGREIKY